VTGTGGGVAAAGRGSGRGASAVVGVTAGAAAAACARWRSSAASRDSSARTCPRAPIAITSATIAMTGNASRRIAIGTISMSRPGT
jgi:hypothetical protein